MKKRIFSKGLLFFILGLFFTVQLVFFNRTTQSFGFADESEHLTPAWMMIHGKSLYQDLSTNHQPLPILAAYVLLKYVHHANLFSLIENVRRYLFVLSFFGALILTIRFRTKGLIASILIEAVKYYFFGYHLLAESLVVYPIMFVAGLLLESKKSKMDDLTFGACVFLIAFSLIPTWPFLLLATVFYLVNNRSGFSIIRVGLSFIIPTFLLFLIIKPGPWYQETVFNNFTYFVPYETSHRIIDSFLISVYPILSVVSLNQVIARFYFFLSILCLLVISPAIKKKRRTLKDLLAPIFFYCLLISLNLRVTSLDIGLYSAFHVLPQAAFFTMLAVCLAYRLKKLSLLLVASVIFALSVGWWAEAVRNNKLETHFINYGDEESIGLALASIKNNDDTLLAGPQSFLNIAADIPLATRQTAYLSWGYRVPQLKSEIASVMEKRPPTFIYFPPSDDPYFKYLQPFLEKDYVRIRRSFGNETDLYILSKNSNINSQQWGNFERLLYQRPLK